MVPRLLERYRTEITPKLSEEFGYENPHQVPKMTKIVVNVGLGEAHRTRSCSTRRRRRWRRSRARSP